MLTDAELREIRERWTPKAGLYKGTYFPPDSLVVTATMSEALLDIPRLLDEIEQLRLLRTAFLAYDMALQRAARAGKSWVDEAELDRLYDVLLSAAHPIN